MQALQKDGWHIIQRAPEKLLHMTSGEYPWRTPGDLTVTIVSSRGSAMSAADMIRNKKRWKVVVAEGQHRGLNMPVTAGPDGCWPLHATEAEAYE